MILRTKSFLKRAHILYLGIFIAFNFQSTILAQFSVGLNDTINPGLHVTLTATFEDMGIPVSFEGNTIMGPFPIGFNFSFFGNLYSQFYIGANGWISFSPNPNAAGNQDAFTIPSTSSNNPKNCILGPFQALYPLSADTPYIFYTTADKPPYRKLVVLWCQAPMYQCDTSYVTFQIQLHEGSNRIETHIFNKPSCNNWNNNNATLGIQDSIGHIGFSVPGRNGTSWTAQKEGWEYIPIAIDSFAVGSIPYQPCPIAPGNKIIYRWYEGNEIIGNTNSLIVFPSTTTDYRAIVTLCDGREFIDSVKVVVVPIFPNAFTPNGDGLNDKFRIIGVQPENITEFNLQIFNRLGQIIFSTSDITEGWDGNFNGAKCPTDTYVWKMFYTDNKKTIITKKGTVILIR